MAMFPEIRSNRYNFIIGMARSIDLFGRLSDVNSIPSLKYSDMKAIHSDWQAVGNDLKMAMVDYGKEKAAW